MVSVKKSYLILGVCLIFLLGCVSIVSSVMLSNRGKDYASDSKVLAAGEGYMLYEKDIKALISDYRKGLVNSKVRGYVVVKESGDLGIELNEEDVENEYKNIIAQYNSEDDFLKILEERNMTVDDLKDLIRESFCDDKLRGYFLEKMFDVSDTDVKKLYNENEDVFNYVTAKHILVDTEEEALSIISKLKNGEDFNVLAEEYSKEEDFDLGEVRRGWMIPEFEEALFALEEGEITYEPVKTAFGYHIIECTGVFNSYEDVKHLVREDYVNANGYSAYDEYVNRLIEKYGVEIY